ncbi:MAG: hypothetical protein KGR48_06635 [Alphaproteobacteria bacterium]|nr:hypothetical protein [Alphaproteobacteria bacterium]MDE2012443.1 hypothetical protein [Alphaproteobacteria bacterium]MDE2072081.1 hypothetical protein [Alphaproteobacteria bacterium]MDE2352796.1 hypothetical protein [Alphaproteobacteria bacterium]
MVRARETIALGRPLPHPAGRLVLGLALALGGCAHLPAWLSPQPKAAQQAPPPPVIPRAREEPHKRKPAAPVRPAEQARPPVQVASIDPHSLVGLTAPAVTQLLGKPGATANDQMSLVWTYAGDGCVLKIYFYSDLKTADFHVLKYSVAGADGAPLADAAPCLRQIQSAKNDDRG